MNEQALNKKRRSANRLSKRRGRTIGKKAIKLMKFSIFITNIPMEILSAEAIMSTYRAVGG